MSARGRGIQIKFSNSDLFREAKPRSRAERLELLKAALAVEKRRRKPRGRPPRD